MNICLNCNTETKNAKYCSRSCAATVNGSRFPKIKKKPPTSCRGCGVDTHNNAFCSNKCQQRHRSATKVGRFVEENSMAASSGLLSRVARAWLIDQANSQCTQCGWDAINPVTGKSPLEVDHVNGDPYDNRLENLRVLCPNCHALTPTSKALNSNKSRKKYGLPEIDRENMRPDRKKYYTTD